MPDGPAHDPETMHAAARAVVHALGEGWAYALEGRRIVIVGPGGSRDAYRHGGASWEQLVALARELAERRREAADGAAPASRL